MMKTEIRFARLTKAFGTAVLFFSLASPASAQDCPEFVGSTDTPGTALSVSVVGNYAYVADGDSGLRVMDVSDPNSPELVGF